MKIRQNITAIIYDKRGKVLSVGKNSYVKTHPIQAKWAKHVGQPAKEYLHAEIDSIIKCRDLSKAHKIVIIRVGVKGELKLAKPCPICESAIKSAGIKIVQHT